MMAKITTFDGREIRVAAKANPYRAGTRSQD
jgi:hypothetical protein